MSLEDAKIMKDYRIGYFFAPGSRLPARSVNLGSIISSCAIRDSLLLHAVFAN